MSDAPPAPWHFGDTALTVLPDISWDEFETLWNTVSGLHRGANWYLGDALLAGSQYFGERYAQVVDGYAVEQRDQARWVASRFDPTRRRPKLSWSLHRECSRLDKADQDALLDQAEREGWHTKDMAAARRRILAERAAATPLYPRNGAPEGEISPLDEIEGQNQPGAGAEPMIAGSAPQATEPVDGAGRTVGSIPATGATPIEELRAIIAEIRVLSHGVTAGSPNKYRLTETAERINEACHLGQYPLAPLHEEIAALALIPRGWVMSSASGEPGSWNVELIRSGGKFAVGTGPLLVLALTEAALAARISEASA